MLRSASPEAICVRIGIVKTTCSKDGDWYTGLVNKRNDSLEDMERVASGMREVFARWRARKTVGE
jgi:hypothetical protein